MKKIIHLVSISIKYHLKINHQHALFPRYSSFKTGKPKLICDVIYSCIRNDIYETKNISQKADKIHLIFPPICSHTTLL